MSEEKFRPITLEPISEDSARELINSKSNVVIVHSKDECAVCQYFIPEVLQPIFKDFNNVEFRLIKDKLVFPVGSHPVTYMFKDGKCVMHPSGSAPEKAVREMMDKLYGNPI